MSNWPVAGRHYRTVCGAVYTPRLVDEVGDKIVFTMERCEGTFTVNLEEWDADLAYDPNATQEREREEQ